MRPPNSSELGPSEIEPEAASKARNAHRYSGAQTRRQPARNKTSFSPGLLRDNLAPMRIVDLMSETLVLPEMLEVERDGALRELVDHLVKYSSSLNVPRELVWERLVAREQLASTAVGRGIAIPHAKLPVTKAFACFGRSRRGVDFGSRDGAPTHLFLTIIAPEGNAGLHLKALARASRLLMDESFRAKMVEGSDQPSLWRVLEEHDANLTN